MFYCLLVTCNQSTVYPCCVVLPSSLKLRRESYPPRFPADHKTSPGDISQPASQPTTHRKYTHTRTQKASLSAVFCWDCMASAIWHGVLKRQAARWGEPGEQASVIMSVTYYLLCILSSLSVSLPVCLNFCEDLWVSALFLCQHRFWLSLSFIFCTLLMLSVLLFLQISMCSFHVSMYVRWCARMHLCVIISTIGDSPDNNIMQ